MESVAHLSSASYLSPAAKTNKPLDRCFMRETDLSRLFFPQLCHIGLDGQPCQSPALWSLTGNVAISCLHWRPGQHARTLWRPVGGAERCLWPRTARHCALTMVMHYNTVQNYAEFSQLRVDLEDKGPNRGLSSWLLHTR
eukprot:52541-Amphidinium_carterae.1